MYQPPKYPYWYFSTTFDVWECFSLWVSLRNIVIKSDNSSKMADTLQQTEVSIENNIKMLKLVERESKRFIIRNKNSELKKCKANIETRM